ncbi:MAG: UDP-N-acetylmuramoyl-tripeptide--D-alanyl-D-alanine ligase [Planctomycetaceae bacterium]|nr:UDP-N-acetylmuramoyl-tripeptide--D-alanyl-D-alanine ligase [Planctomycetaceae bacterium]
MIRRRVLEIADVVGGRPTGDLREGDPLVHGIGTDTRVAMPGRLFVAIPGERHDGHDHLEAARDAGAAAAMVESAFLDAGGRLPEGLPGISVPKIRPALADLARDHRRRLTGTVIGITGSSGKTTIRSMAEHVLAGLGPGTASIRSFNNDLGVPLTMLEADEADRWVLLEIGTNAPGEIAHLAGIADPTIGILSGVGRAHLGGFGSRAAIAAEKCALIDAVAANQGITIANIDGESITAEIDRRIADGIRVVTYGESSTADRRLRRRAIRPGGGQEIDLGDFVGEIALDGRHNAMNAVAVVELARRLGVADADIARRLSTLSPPPMRFVRHAVGGIKVVDDAYNANPESMRASLETFGEIAADADRRIVVLGGMRELGVRSSALHEEVGAFAATVADVLVLVGDEDAAAIGRGALEAGFKGVPHQVADRAAAAALLAARVAVGDAILFKGSRAVGLDRVVLSVLEEWEARG